MNPALIAVLIFCLRIVDVSIGTIRVIFTIRGQRLIAASLGFVESAVWIFAISRAMKFVDHPYSMLGWGAGFAAGTALGITLERWIATGNVILRVISTEKAHALRDALRAAHAGVTAVPAEGRGGAVLVLFCVAPRKRAREITSLIQSIDPHAFLTIDPVGNAIGGYLPATPPAAAIRK